MMPCRTSHASNTSPRPPLLRCCGETLTTHDRQTAGFSRAWSFSQSWNKPAANIIIIIIIYIIIIIRKPLLVVAPTTFAQYVRQPTSNKAIGDGRLCPRPAIKTPLRATKSNRVTGRHLENRKSTIYLARFDRYSRNLARWRILGLRTGSWNFQLPRWTN